MEGNSKTWLVQRLKRPETNENVTNDKSELLEESQLLDFSFPSAFMSMFS